MSENKEWTVMVYMAGDNNLNTEMVYALEQIREVAIDNPNVDLYAYLDGSSDEVPTLYCDFTHKGLASGPNNPGNLIQSYKIQDKLIETTRSFNENSAAVNNIINFVNWCVKKDSEETRKKKKYAFVFSGHSFGFLNWGLYRDEKSSYSMTHSKLRYMFERITWSEEKLREKAEKDEAEYRKRYEKDWSDKYRDERRTVILGKSLELLGFDSCVMSTIELGCQFSKFAKTMVASEGSIPTAGWNYTQILLGKITKEPKADANEIAISFVEEFIKQQNKFALADISVDISAWDLTKLKDLEQKFGILSERLLECVTDKNPVVYNQMRRLLVFAHWKCQTYMLEQQIDLGDFCHILAEEIESLKNELKDQDIEPIKKVGDACLEVIEKIKDCILLTGFSGTDFQFSNGVSLFFPWSLASYRSAQKDYEKLIFIKENSVGQKWNEFLNKYLGEATFRKSIPITEKDENGDMINTSVIYKSYEGVDDDFEIQTGGNGSNNSDDHKQPPNSGRQPPNSGRQPPNSGRMLSDMNYFLSRFIRLKNFQSGWNKAGFKSNNVRFSDQPFLSSKIPSLNTASTKPVIYIPTPRPIEKRIDQLFQKIYKLGENKVEKAEIDEYIKRFKELFEKSDESEIIKILGNVSESDFFNSKELREDDLRSALNNSYTKSLGFVSDNALREELTKSFEKSSLKR